MPPAMVMAGLTYFGVTASVGASLAAVVGATVSTAAATAIGASAISAGLSIASGGSVSDALKSAVVGGVASYVGGSVASSVGKSVAASAASSGFTDVAQSMGNVAGNMAGGATSGGISAAAYGGDPIEAMLQGGLAAGLASGASELVNYSTSKIAGFDKVDPTTGNVVKGDLPIEAQRALKSALAAGISGNDPNQAVIDSVLDSYAPLILKSVEDKYEDFSGSLRSSYDNAKNAALVLDNNIVEQQKIADEANALIDQYKQNQEKLNNGISGGANSISERAALSKTQKSVLAAIQNKRNEFDALSEDQLSFEENFITFKKDLDENTATFLAQEKKNADLINAEAKRIADISSSYKERTGEDITYDQILAAFEAPKSEGVGTQLGDPTAANTFAGVVGGYTEPSLLVPGNEAGTIYTGDVEAEREVTPNLEDTKSGILSAITNNQVNSPTSNLSQVTKQDSVGNTGDASGITVQTKNLAKIAAQAQADAIQKQQEYIDQKLALENKFSYQGEFFTEQARLEAELAQQIANQALADSNMGGNQIGGISGISGEPVAGVGGAGVSGDGVIDGAGEAGGNGSGGAGVDNNTSNFGGLGGVIASAGVIDAINQVSGLGGQIPSSPSAPSPSAPNASPAGGLTRINTSVSNTYGYKAPKPFVENPSFTLLPVAQQTNAVKNPFAQNFFRVGGLAAIRRN